MLLVNTQLLMLAAVATVLRLSGRIEVHLLVIKTVLPDINVVVVRS